MKHYRETRLLVFEYRSQNHRTLTRIVVSQELRKGFLIWILSEMQSELATPGSACPLPLQWRSSLPRRCPGCPSWSRRAWPSDRRCSTAGCRGSEAPLGGSARCKPPALGRCGEPPSARRCRRLPDEECQSGEALSSNMFQRSANDIPRHSSTVWLMHVNIYQRKFWDGWNGTTWFWNDDKWFKRGRVEWGKTRFSFVRQFVVNFFLVRNITDSIWLCLLYISRNIVWNNWDQNTMWTTSHLR